MVDTRGQLENKSTRPRTRTTKRGREPPSTTKKADNEVMKPTTSKVSVDKINIIIYENF